MADSEEKLDEYFMAIALLCEKRSKDKLRQVGTCIVDKHNTVISTGYNGMPLNCHDCLMPWDATRPRETSDSELRDGTKSKYNTDEEGVKHDYVCHAEMNAIVNKDPKSVEGCTLYVTLSPCNECAKVVVQSGIAKVVYLSGDKRDEKFEAGESILRDNGVTLIQFEDRKKKLVLSLSDGIVEKHSTNKTTQEKEDQPKQIISWEQFFMGQAKLTAELRSKSSCKEGACVVNEDNRNVGLGHVHDAIPIKEGLEKKDFYVCHAPAAAIVKKNLTSVKDCILYATKFPCKECAKIIVQSGIRKVVYLEENEPKKATRRAAENPNPKVHPAIRVDPATRMFAIAHVKEEQLSSQVLAETIELDFAKVIPDEEKQT